MKQVCRWMMAAVLMVLLDGCGGVDGMLKKDALSKVESTMVMIPSDSFMMGSNSGDKNEKPVHRVHINSFKMGKYEVTQALWQAVMGNNPSAFKGANRPVEQVSWDDIQRFLKNLNRISGKHFRLPTESEWEYAARAGSTTKYSWGNDISCDKASYDGGKSSSCYYRLENHYRGTQSVGSYAPNSYGLYDMHGNVWEWVQDRYHSSYKGAPNDGSAWEGRGSPNRVLRGGAWIYGPGGLRSANRVRDFPAFSNFICGFRLAQD